MLDPAPSSLSARRPLGPTRRRGAAIAALGLLLGCLPGVAEAQKPKGVVLDFDGRGSAQARRAVVSALSDDVDLVPSADVEATAQDLGADLSTAEGVETVAIEMGIRLFVDGTVTGRGRRAKTRVRFRDDHGEELGEARAGSPTGRAGRRRVGRATQAALDDVLATLAERPPAEKPEPEPEVELPPVMQATDDELPGGLDSEEPGGEEEEEEDEGDTPAGRPPLFEIYAGGTLRNREAEINLVNGNGREYSSGGLFFELALRAELRPLNTSDSLLQGWFIIGEYGQSIGLSSAAEQGAMTTEYGTSTLRVWGRTGLLFDLVEGEATVSVGPDIGFGYETFSIDDNPIMPSTAYPQLRAGVAARLALAGGFWGQIDGALRFPFSVGDMADEFGADASASGFDVGLSLGVGLDMGLAFAARASILSMGLDFSGDAMQPAEDGDDEAIFITLQVGYQFR